MRLHTIAFFVSAGVAGLTGFAAEATRPIEATDRNTTFEPNATIAPEKQAPGAQLDSRVQDQRFDTTVVDRKMAPTSGQKSTLEVQETRDKKIVPKDSSRPEAQEQSRSAFNQKKAAISTSNDTKKPPTVTKYQEGLSAASASNMARFPALDGATTAKINRFVFRKNPTETGLDPGATPITPAAGGSPVRTQP